jgi:hypothetical protein
VIYFPILTLLILPALFLMLIARATHVELTPISFSERQDVIKSETTAKKFLRFMLLLLEATSVNCLLIAIPFMISLIIIPLYGHGLAASLSVGLFCLVVFLFQVVGTLRTGVSVTLRRKRDRNYSDQKNQSERGSGEPESGGSRGRKMMFWKSRWFAGLVTLISLALEFFQVSLYPFLYDSSSPLSSSTGIPGENSAKVIITAGQSVYLNILTTENVFWIAVALVGGLQSLFCFQFMGELRKFALMRKLAGESYWKVKAARHYLFSSFVGAVVYSHGEPKQMSKVLTAVIGTRLFHCH